MGTPNHPLVGGWHWSELPTMLWETSLLETLAASQQLGWQESRFSFVFSSCPISISAFAHSDKLFYSSTWGIAGRTLEAWFCSLFWVVGVRFFCCYKHQTLPLCSWESMTDGCFWAGHWVGVSFYFEIRAQEGLFGGVSEYRGSKAVKN